MMAEGNPTWWWNVNGIRSPPSPPPPVLPVSLGGLAPSNVFTDHHLYAPTASGASANSSSSSSSYSWQDLHNPELPESWSQLLLYIYTPLSLSRSLTVITAPFSPTQFVQVFLWNMYAFLYQLMAECYSIPIITSRRGLMAGEDYSSGNKMSHFQDQRSPDMDLVKQENSASGYNHVYGHLNDQQDIRLGSTAKPPTWSSIAPVSSSSRSRATAMETNSVPSFSKKKPGTRNPPRDRAYEVPITLPFLYQYL